MLNMPIQPLQQLVQKYNVAAPRYTSYPTVPTWQSSSWNEEVYFETARRTILQDPSGIALYVHLPFCESLCTYCGCNTRITKNHQVEEPYINALIKEWGLFKEKIGLSTIPIKELHLGGGTPTFFSPDHLQHLIYQLLDGTPPMKNAAFSFEAHPANTKEDHLSALFEVGFRRLSLGIQDFDPEVQAVIHRYQTEEEVWKVMEKARSIGYESINFDLIYGLPLQTTDRIESTIRKTMELKPDRISFYSYAHVPWIKPSQRMFTEDMLPKASEKLALYTVGKEMILDQGYQEVGMDHFALPGDSLLTAAHNGTLHRNFMGYTDQHTQMLVGLGVSSISDAWNGYAQNEKTVEGYYARIHAGELAYCKGHILDQYDRILRRQILDLMCKGETELDPTFLYYSEIYERLQPLLLDHLITIEDHTCRISVLGQSFLRNICMAFDVRMHQASSPKIQFSQAV
jgi:oxygen-independent coproporphyrinogen-3 oxidase